jgi:hypothetical protein
VYLLVGVPVFCQQSGYLAKFVDNNGHLGNSVVFQLGNRVGIGTTIPGFPLTVQNGIYVNGVWWVSLRQVHWCPLWQSPITARKPSMQRMAPVWELSAMQTSTTVSQEFGVAGFAASIAGTGVYGQRVTGSSLATRFENQSGVWGDSADGTGVNATSDMGIALWAPTTLIFQLLTSLTLWRAAALSELRTVSFRNL